jgi:hypothetical protein
MQSFVKSATVENLPFFLKYSVEGKSFGTLQEAALNVRDLTLRVPYAFKNRLERPLPFSQKTMFWEIQATSEDINPHIGALLPRVKNHISVDQGELATRVVRAIEIFIEKFWVSKKFHFMMHSSGHDSRILSYILKKLHKKLGDDWLGQVVFCCWPPEVNEFFTIMDWMGWDKKHLLPFHTGLSGVDFLRDVVSWGVCGEFQAEPNRFARVRPWYTQILGDLEILSGDVQIIYTGYTPGQWHYPFTNLEHFLRYHRSDTGCIPCDHSIVPFGSLDVLKLMLQHHVERDNILPQPADLFKKHMCDVLHPDLWGLPNRRMMLLKGVPPIVSKDRVLSDATRVKMERMFKDSWYFKTFDLDGAIPLLNRILPTPLWGEYIKAAICQYLIDRGCTIKLGGP